MTEHLTIDVPLETVAGHKRRWARLPISDKIEYLKQVRALVLDNAELWVEAGARLKGFSAKEPLAGSEEWLGGPYPTVAWISDVIHTLESVKAGKDPLSGIPITTRPDGQLVLRVMPASIYDRLLLSGYSLDVWMQPDVTRDSLRAATFYDEPDPQGRLTLVLGAGNVSAIPVLDALYALFVQGDVVLLKLNPVADVYGPVFEAIFAPLIEDGYLDIVYGAADVGEYMVHHEQVDTVHITGSGRSFDAIVWGSQAAKDADAPILTKPITSELGGVGPTIVIPGQWTDADIEYQAQHLATQKLHTSGHTCVASQVLVLAQDWPQREQFLDAFRQAVLRAPRRRPFYPGAEQRQQDLLAANPTAEVLDEGQRLILLEDLDPASDHPAFREEFFGPLYATVSLQGESAPEFLATAVDFVNERLAGNLGANLIVDDATAREHSEALDSALADLRFGCIGVNAWSAVAFLTSRAAWGAFAGNGARNIESGSGAVHNSLMLDKPEKNVVTAPFRPFPRSARHGGLTMAVKPPWFLENKTALSTARQFTHFAADPHPRRLPGLFASALRG
jgi:aldehyde dehydrogenase (NAD(P)+)